MHCLRHLRRFQLFLIAVRQPRFFFEFKQLPLKTNNISKSGGFGRGVIDCHLAAL
jgi:hypothetical protein